MYHLTCPACQKKMPTPFVRMGAVATCKHCSNRFRVDAEHVELAPAKPVAEDDPLLPRSAVPAGGAPAAGTGGVIETRPPAGQAARKAAAPAGAPGAAPATAGGAADPTAELAHAAEAPGGSKLGKTLARRAVQRRKRRPIAALAITTLVIAIIVAAAAIYGFNKGYILKSERTASPPAPSAAHIPPAAAAPSQEPIEEVP